MAAVSDVSGAIAAPLLRKFGQVSRGYTHFKNGDVIWAKITPCMENGKAAVAEGLSNGVACGSTEFYVLRSTGAVEPRFLHRFLRQKRYRQTAAQAMTGAVGQRRVPKSFLLSTAFPLPPLAEQRRIVARLEQLEARSRRARAALQDLPALLAQARQSLLAAAFRGDLTKGWRQRMGRERKASARSAQSVVKIPNRADLPKLPKTWSWVALGNHARCFRGKFTPRPRNDPRYFDGRHPFIQIGNLPREGGLVTSHTQTLNDEGLAVSRKFPKGTVVIAIVGATIGNTGVLAYDMCMTDSLVGMETETAEGNRYLELFLRHKKRDIRQAAYSSGGQPNIKLEFLDPYPLALPPLAEQREIVRRLQRGLARLDAAQAAYEAAVAELDRLDQSLLAQAFAGQLVPQDPRDEPASALLARIQPENGRS
jgi:type I restriction enzyme S subunit